MKENYKKINKLALFGGKKTISQKFSSYNSIGKEELNAVQEVVKSGELSSFLGTHSKDFYGGKKVIDGKRKMLDGVDVAVNIWEKFEETEILFFSGCIIESGSKDIFNFKDKFEDYTGDPIENYILPKDSSFEDELDKLTELFLGV